MFLSFSCWRFLWFPCHSSHSSFLFAGLLDPFMFLSCFSNAQCSCHPLLFLSFSYCSYHFRAVTSFPCFSFNYFAFILITLLFLSVVVLLIPLLFLSVLYGSFHSLALSSSPCSFFNSIPEAVAWCLDGRMDGWLDGRTDGRTKGQWTTW